MYKKIIIEEIETDYLIYDDGRVYSLKTKKFLNGDKSSGYLRYLLCVNGKKYRMTAHRLVAEAFIPNPSNLPIVDHKDKDRLNNSVDNLQWITYSENVKGEKRNNYPIIEMSFTDEELDSEVWRQFRDTSYYFSNLGRMFNKKTNKIVKGHANFVLGYLRDILTLDDGSQLVLPRHRMVFEAFNPDANINIINHKNGCRWNNRLNNLENVSASENLRKAYTETKSRKVRHCSCEKEGLVLAFWSIADAAATLKISESQIRRAMNCKGSAHGYKCRDITEEEYSQIVKSSETIERITNEKDISENRVE